MPSIAEIRGPGVHHAIKVWAKRHTHKTMKNFDVFVIAQCEDFGCSKCTPHCKAYIKNHLPSKQKKRTAKTKDGKVVDVTAFEWAVNFHNAVNARIGKPLVSFETAFDAYYNTNLCIDGDCDGDLSDNATNNKLNYLASKKSGVIYSLDDTTSGIDVTYRKY